MLERQFASSSVFYSYINSVSLLCFLTSNCSLDFLWMFSSLQTRVGPDQIRSDQSSSLSLRLQPGTDLEHQAGGNSLQFPPYLSPLVCHVQANFGDRGIPRSYLVFCSFSSCPAIQPPTVLVSCSWAVLLRLQREGWHLVMPRLVTQAGNADGSAANWQTEAASKQETPLTSSILCSIAVREIGPVTRNSSQLLSWFCLSCCHPAFLSIP